MSSHPPPPPPSIKTYDVQGTEVKLLENLAARFGLFTWPSAIVLAHWVKTQEHELPGMRVLELGAGTSLPGVLAARLGAAVTLTDRTKGQDVLLNIAKTIELNKDGMLGTCDVQGLTWGTVGGGWVGKTFDVVLGSDVLYSSKDFDAVLASVHFLLSEQGPKEPGHAEAACFMTYQERSSKRSIRHLLAKWGLRAEEVPTHTFLPPEVLQDSKCASVFLLKLTLAPS
ncbi:unnamed protein product [Chrysoparadoxa australica]